MWAEYTREREEKLAPKPIAYEPSEVKREHLEGSGPAVVSGVWGMKEILGEKMAQAERYVEGYEWIEGKRSWESKKQKEDTLEVVEGLKKAGGGVAEGKEKAQGGKADDVLLTRLFSGGYITAHPSLRNAGSADVLNQVGRQTAHNSSYDPVDEQSLLGKVRSLVAATPPVAKGKPARQRAKT